MDSEHVVGDSDRGSRKRQRNTTSKERKKEIRQDHALRSMNKIRGISEAKRVVIIKRPEKKTVVVKTEIFYRNDDLRQKFVSLLKKGKKLDNIKFPEVNLVHEIKRKKLDTELQWLLAVFPPDMNNHEDTNSQTEDDDEDVHEHVCECNEDDRGHKNLIICVIEFISL
ncbi:hypothetical protein ILUMI_17570 [Ignelater luminosus]|uniref:Uncharacterized protein n=1 Tax=Ignelater luminosus TaxID=2038154 RepID=A0A8K0CQ87_IGNLU|nr:hypothetical protein ILUMI_17570 [Ignelater luminosus]